MTTKNKNILLLLGFLIMLFIGYVFAFSETASVYSNYTALKKQEAIAQTFPKKKFNLEKKKTYYDSLLKYYRISDTSLQNNLLNTIERFAVDENLKIISFEKPHIFKDKGYTVLTYSFIVSGDYSSIINLSYQLEQKNKFGMISHLKIDEKINHKTKEVKLNGHFLLQLIK